MRDVDRRRAACTQKAQLAYCIRHALSHSLVIADERAARLQIDVHHLPAAGSGACTAPHDRLAEGG